MSLSFKAGDLVQTNVGYIDSVLKAIKSPSPTVFQTVQSLGLLQGETAKVLSIGYMSIDGVFHTAIHILPTNKLNALCRGGKGTRIYLNGEDQVNGSLTKVS